jgi:hypothetical protein
LNVTRSLNLYEMRAIEPQRGLRPQPKRRGETAPRRRGKENLLEKNNKAVDLLSRERREMLSLVILLL